MQGRTHLAVGCAAALALLAPNSLPLLVGGGTSAALGSVLSDIDAEQSGAGHDAARAFACAVIIFAAVVFADTFLHLGIYERFVKRVDMSRRIPAGLLFLVVCAFGVLSRHRSFMHSFAGMLVLTVCVWRMAPSLAPFFAVGFLSHLALDLLNRKGICLFFPSKKRFSIGLCRADGLVDRVLFLTGMAALGVIVYRSLH